MEILPAVRSSAEIYGYFKEGGFFLLESHFLKPFVWENLFVAPSSNESNALF